MESVRFSRSICHQFVIIFVAISVESRLDGILYTENKL